ncbi:MAG: hypothetical protein ABJB47_02840 [Actinomycetota bacterium]
MAEYQQHYNTARPHQGIDQRVPDTDNHPPRLITTGFDTHQIRRKPVLSGLINEYITSRLRARNRRSRPESYFRAAHGYAQATGCFRWWWQALGSNQRRLSRRFYREAATDDGLRLLNCCCVARALPGAAVASPWLRGLPLRPELAAALGG